MTASKALTRLAWFIAVVLVVGCAPRIGAGVGGFNREIVGGGNIGGRYLDPVARPGLQVNKSDEVIVAVQRLPKSVVGGSLTTTSSKMDDPRILRAWVVALNYSNHEIRFGSSVVSLADDNQTQLHPLSAEALAEWANERIRKEATMLRESMLAPHAFTYGSVYFLSPPEQKLVFPLHLRVSMGDEYFEVEFTENR